MLVPWIGSIKIPVKIDMKNYSVWEQIPAIFVSGRILKLVKLEASIVFTLQVFHSERSKYMAMVFSHLGQGTFCC